MLEELEQQERELCEKLAIVRKAMKTEKLLIAEHRFGVRIGSIVKDRKGVEHRVTGIHPSNFSKPWLEGNPKKKDGSFGVAVRHLYSNWDMVGTKPINEK